MVIAALAAAGRGEPPAPPVDGFDLPETSAAGERLSLWATNYYVYAARDAPGGVPLLDKHDAPLGLSLASRDWCAAAIEGTVRVARAHGSPALLNYDGLGGTPVVDCAPHVPPSRHAEVPVAALGRTRWRRAHGPYGDGARSWVLVPFRTVAVDPRVLPLGTVLYVPAARGAKLTVDGRALAHDGYFFAGDTGGAIRGNHIDVFTGTAAKSPLAFVRSRPTHVFEAFVIRDPAVVAWLEGLHRRR